MTAGAYTHGHHESVLRSHRWRTADNSCAYLLPLLRPGMRLLDVGCGPATITADLAQRVDVVGIDPSPSVIGEARAAYPHLDLRTDDLFEHAGRYDVVHAHQVLQHLVDPVAALVRMGELAPLVAARDGDYPAFVWTPSDECLDRWLDLYLQVTRHNGANADAGRHLLAWAHAAGFDDVTFSTSTWTFATPDDRAWWGGLWAERTTSSTFAEQAVAYGLATAEELTWIAEGWRSWAAQPTGAFVVLHGEILARRGRS